jgi:hypothetical protein
MRSLFAVLVLSVSVFPQTKINPGVFDTPTQVVSTEIKTIPAHMEKISVKVDDTTYRTDSVAVAEQTPTTFSYRFPEGGWVKYFPLTITMKYPSDTGDIFISYTFAPTEEQFANAKGFLANMQINIIPRNGIETR